MKELKIGVIDKRIFILDYLKGFSIFTIALMHLIHMIPNIPKLIITFSMLGGTGVHVFFICSGIGLYMSYSHKKTTYSEFLRKRFLKIYLPYIAIVLLSFFVPWMYDGEDRISALCSHIFLYKMFVTKYEQSFGTQLWFISTIIQFYLIFILLCNLKDKLKNNKLFFIIFMFVSIFWWIFCYIARLTDIRIWNSFFLQYIWEFVLGIILGELFYKGKSIKIKYIWLLISAITGIAIQGAMTIAWEKAKIFNDIPALIGYTSLTLLFFRIEIIKKSLLWIASISYEYYLVHIIVFLSIKQFWRGDGLANQVFLVVIAMSTAIGVAYFYNKMILFIMSQLSRKNNTNC